MNLTFTPAFRIGSVALVLGASLLIHHLARGQQSGTQEPAQGQQSLAKLAQGFCAPKVVRKGEDCEYSGAVFLYDDNDRIVEVECFYTCPSDDLPGEFQVVESKNQELTTFDNLPLEEQQATLWNKGPLVPASFNRYDMSMRGFVKAGWSLYVLYSLKENTANLKVWTKYIGPFSQELRAGKKMQAVFNVPDLFGPELQVASISLNAPLDSGFELHAIGILEAGRNSKHHASRFVVDMKEPISDITATPDKIRTQMQEKISYSFFSRSPYTFASADFFSLKPDVKDHIVPTRVHSSTYDNVKANKKTVTREWDGKNWKGQYSLGEHQLQIRAWRGQGTSGEWFGPFYGPKVAISK